MFISYFIKILLVSLSFNSHQNKGGLTLTAEIGDSIVTKKEDLFVKLQITNSTSKQILIHKYIQYGYMSSCEDDFCFEVEKNLNDQYSKMEELADIDRVPGYDSLGVAWDDMYDTLSVGKSYLAKFNIIGYYHLQKGKYRTRFRFNIPAKNNVAIKNIYSNWVFFEVKSDDVEYYQ